MQASLSQTYEARPARRVGAAIVAVAFGALVSGCSTGSPAGPGEYNDPYEPTNRKIHSFNKGVDRAVYRPVSNVYGTVVPSPIRAGVLNFAETVDLPQRIVNDILQGNIVDGVHNFFRFSLNATIGVFGIFDPAEAMGLEERDTDFGETLHVWGVGEGAYLSIPFLGPSTQRDFAGDVVDLVTNPLGYVLSPPQSYYGPTAKVGEYADYRYTYRDSIDDVLDNSADSYAAARQVYLDSRHYDLGIPAAGAGASGDDLGYIDPYEELYGD